MGPASVGDAGRVPAKAKTAGLRPELRPEVEVDPYELMWGERRPRVLNVLQRSRIRTGLSQQELAVQLGVSRQTISSIENRRTVPSVRLALALAIALQASVEELFPAEEL